LTDTSQREGLPLTAFHYPVAYALYKPNTKLSPPGWR